MKKLLFLLCMILFLGFTFHTTIAQNQISKGQLIDNILKIKNLKNNQNNNNFTVLAGGFNFPTAKNYLKSLKANKWNFDTIIDYDTTNTQSQRITQTFNSHLNALTIITELWQSNAWVNSSMETYTYDSNGNILTEIIQNWESNAWVD